MQTSKHLSKVYDKGDGVMVWITTLDWTTIAIATIISAVISSMATLWVNRKSREKYKNDLGNHHLGINGCMTSV